MKTVGARYLEDETVLLRLREGERTGVMRLSTHPHGTRWSCYLRLRTAHPHLHGWSYGLVRLEAFDRDLLEPAARLVMACRQPVASDDPRADRHIKPIAVTEYVGRAIIPNIFDYL